MFCNNVKTASRGVAAAALAVGLATPAFADEVVEAVSNTFYGLLNEMTVGKPVAERLARLAG